MQLKLYSFKICPFVERTNILLIEKNIKCERIHVDIRNKPDWFLKISPLGKVPILAVDDFLIFESTVINEYLDEISHNSLHPNEPTIKAQNRSWIEWSYGLLSDAYFMTIAENKEEHEAKKKAVFEKLQILENLIVHQPFFNGIKFCMIDLALSPLFRRFDTLKRNYQLDILANYPKLLNWSNSVLSRSSVQQGFADNFDEEFNLLLVSKRSCLAMK